tara:strand:- start:560 stop:739 length:180 start_codon:yes stop_codon:yes gene_type:complete
MTFNQALQKLKDERTLYTDMLEPLNLSFEYFLRMAQLSDKGLAKVTDRLIAHLESKIKE